jgi:hypothetical protein
MKSMFAKIFFKHQYDVPDKVEKAFNKNFKQPAGVEWVKTGQEFEVLFFENNLEKIAHFELDGTLREIRINHPTTRLTPNDFKLDRMGMIMNYIEIRKGTTIQHELIIRNQDMSRSLVLLNEHFERIKEEAL